MIPLLLLACSTLSTLDGARTLDPGVGQVGGAINVQSAASFITNEIPLPQIELATRYGVADDVDIGARAWLLGAGFDVRYRFLQQGPWHVAVQPGLAAFVLPDTDLSGTEPSGTGLSGGSIDLRMPITAELELHRAWSVTGGPRLLHRVQWNSSAFDSRPVARLDSYVGGGAGLRFQPRKLGVFVAGELLAQPVRRAGPAWTVGLGTDLRIGGDGWKAK